MSCNAEQSKSASSWVRPVHPQHAHFDCFSGAAGDMILAACLDAAGPPQSDALLRHVDICLRQGLPALNGEFSIQKKKVWRGVGKIAATHVVVHSLYNHEPAPVPHPQTQRDPSPTRLRERRTPELDNERHKMTPARSPTRRSSGGIRLKSSVSRNDSGQSSGDSDDSTQRKLRAAVSGKGGNLISPNNGKASLGCGNNSRRSLNENKTNTGSLLNDSKGSTGGLNDSKPNLGESFDFTETMTGTDDKNSSQTLPLESLVTPDQVQRGAEQENADLTTDHSHDHTSLRASLEGSSSSTMEASHASHPKLFSSTSITNSPTKTDCTEVTESSHDHDHSHGRVSASGLKAMDPSDDNETSQVHSHGHSHDHSHGFGNSHSHSHLHDHSDSHREHSHAHDNPSSTWLNGPLRNLPEIRKMLEEAPEQWIPHWVRITAIESFTALAKAEATVHGAESIDSVHFHEVGAVDSIVDTVGSLLALNALGAVSFSCSRLPLGEGSVHTAHGIMPVPTPATLCLMIDMPTTAGPPGVSGELVTPTGAALLRTLVMTMKPSNTTAVRERQKPTERPPSFTLRKVGVGAGTKDFDNHPNIIRLILGDTT